jgi:hypothetical protein
MMKLPERIFFTGVPGSRWSGVCQCLEKIPEINTSDRQPQRDYQHHAPRTGRFQTRTWPSFGRMNPAMR